MKPILIFKNTIPWALLILLATYSCATAPGLKVTYLLSGGLSEFKGEEITLIFEDARKMKEILGEGAKNEFKLFSGYMDLTIMGNNERASDVGLLDIESLFLETFGKRLNRLGLKVFKEKKDGRHDLVISLHDFTLDLINRRWVMKITYEGRIERSGKLLSKRSMNGEAERLKIIGHSEADKVASELFTDMVNNLDIDKLLKQGI